VNDRTLAWLCSFGRLWAAIKFLHPYPGYREDLDWDAAFLNAVPRVLSAARLEDHHAAIDVLLAALGDPNTGRVIPEAETVRTAPPSAAVPREPHCRWCDAQTAVVVARDVAQFHAFARDNEFEAACAEAAAAATVVFDLRLRPSALDPACEYLQAGLVTGLPRLLRQPVSRCGVRYRYHEGHVPQHGPGSNLYTSGFTVHYGQPLDWDPDLDRQPRLVVLTGTHTRGVEDVLGGLQAAGVAVVVHGGAVRPAGTTDPRRLMLDPDTAVDICTGEWQRPDGRIGYQPDALLPDPDARADTGLDPARDPSIAAALRAVLAPPQRPRAPGDVPAAWGGNRLRERVYGDTPYPPLPLRLLAAFRLWGVIHHLYPYHDRLDRFWDEALPGFVRRCAAAADAVAYGLAVSEMAAGLQDSHANVWSAALGTRFGDAVPGIAVRTIGGRTLISHVSDPAAGAVGVHAGDEVLAVDGVALPERRASLRPHLSASTPQALERKVDARLLQGADGSHAHLTLRTEAGICDIALRRTRDGADEHPPAVPPVAALPEGFGYIDLARVRAEEIDQALEAMRDTPALIFDLRRYPLGGAWALAPRICRGPVQWYASAPCSAGGTSAPNPSPPGWSRSAGRDGGRSGPRSRRPGRGNTRGASSA